MRPAAGPRYRFALAMLSGALVALAFPSVDLSLCAWVGLVPLLWALEGARPRLAFTLGWFFGFTASVGMVNWVVNPIRHYTDAPAVVAIAALLSLAAAMGVYSGLFAAALSVARGGRAPLALAAPALWVASEWLRSVGSLAFPWNTLGYSLYRYTDLIQVAELTGVYGLSALILYANAVLYGVLRAGRSGRRRSFGQVAVLGILMTGCVLLGKQRLAVLAAAPRAGSIAVGLVQANVDQGRKWNPRFATEVVERHAALTKTAQAEGADLVVWPETAVPFYFQSAGPQRQRLVDLARGIGVDLLFGSLAFSDDGAAVRFMNRAYLIRRDGEVAGSYDKLRLVPFGEFVPLRAVFFFVRHIVEVVGELVSGTEATVFTLPQGRFGVLICYEGIFPNLSRRLVGRGAEFLVNITNDAWFGDTSAPYQHLAMVTLRAVENRVPIARAANTGISAIVDVDGRVRWQTRLFEPAVRTDTLAWPHVRTFYTRFGDVFAALCALASAVLIGYGGWNLRHGIPRRR